MNNNTIYCPFSGQKVSYHLTSDGYINYVIDRDEFQYRIIIKGDFDIESIEYYKIHKHIFYGLWLNKKWPKTPEVIIDSERDLKTIIEENNVPITPKQKIDYLFMAIFNEQYYEGQQFTSSIFFNDKHPEYYYLKAGIEQDYYMETLAEQGYIQIEGRTAGAYNFYITFKGLEYAIKLTEDGKYSKNCFIAMSFQEGMEGKRKAIKEAISENGFDPILIDEQVYNSAQTINDAIIANIKRSKFSIADFTQQRNGVYFEAGYALGRGLPVIYMVSKDDFENTHFDINHFPLLIYGDNAELKKMLSEAIQARIID